MTHTSIVESENEIGTRENGMRKLCLILFRFCPTAWVGAAVLFVLATIAMARSPEIDAEMTMTLTAIRFPVYYSMEFSLLAVAFLTGLISRKSPELGRLRGTAAVVLVGIALGMAVSDYLFIYRPLAEMMRQQTLTDSFRSMHEGSKHINSSIVLVTFFAALLVNWSSRVKRDE